MMMSFVIKYVSVAIGMPDNPDAGLARYRGPGFTPSEYIEEGIVSVCPIFSRLIESLSGGTVRSIHY